MAYVADDIWKAILKYVPDATDLLNINEAFPRNLRPFMSTVHYKTDERRLLNAPAAVDMVVHKKEQIMPKVRKLVMYNVSELATLPSELQELRVGPYSSISSKSFYMSYGMEEVPLSITAPYPETLTSITTSTLIVLKKFPPYLVTAIIPCNSVEIPLPDTLTKLTVYNIETDVLRRSQLRKLTVSSTMELNIQDLPASLTDCKAQLQDDIWKSDLSRFVRLEHYNMFNNEPGIGFNKRELICSEDRLPAMIQKVGIRPIIRVDGFSIPTMELSTKFKAEWIIRCYVVTLGQLPDTTIDLKCHSVNSTYFSRFPLSLTKLDMSIYRDPDALVQALIGTKIKYLSFTSDGVMTKYPPTLKCLYVRGHIQVTSEVLEKLLHFRINTHKHENAKKYALEILQLKGFVCIGLGLNVLRAEAEVEDEFARRKNGDWYLSF